MDAQRIGWDGPPSAENATDKVRRTIAKCTRDVTVKANTDGCGARSRCHRSPVRLSTARHDQFGVRDSAIGAAQIELYYVDALAYGRVERIRIEGRVVVGEGPVIGRERARIRVRFLAGHRAALQGCRRRRAGDVGDDPPTGAEPRAVRVRH